MVDARALESAVGARTAADGLICAPRCTADYIWRAGNRRLVRNWLNNLADLLYAVDENCLDGVEGQRGRGTDEVL